MRKQIPEFPDYYADEDGNIYSRRRVKHNGWRKLSTRSSCGDYFRVTVIANGKKYKRTVHSLVLSAFVGPRPKGLICLHGPAGKYDNSIRNLSYGTISENAADRHRDGTAMYGDAHPNTKIKDKDVAYVLTQGKHISGSELARRFGVCPSVISAIRKRRERRYVNV
jgi:hypothetical protein